jgi:putative transposase
MPWRPKVPSPTWRSFLQNHLTDIVAIDMFVVATATFRLLYALIVLGHDRRRVIHFNVTQYPTQAWLSRQLTEAFPWDTAPRYLLRDRDTSYGPAFRNRVQAMGIEEIVTAPRSPWQNPYVERLIGSIRRECLDHIIIFNERHLRGVLSSYFQYHHRIRTHLSLDKDCPQPRRIQPPSYGVIDVKSSFHGDVLHSVIGSESSPFIYAGPSRITSHPVGRNHRVRTMIPRARGLGLGRAGPISEPAYRSHGRLRPPPARIRRRRQAPRIEFKERAKVMP